MTLLALLNLCHYEAKIVRGLPTSGSFAHYQLPSETSQSQAQHSMIFAVNGLENVTDLSLGLSTASSSSGYPGVLPATPHLKGPSKKFLTGNSPGLEWSI
jgi:hypothetical protein